MGVEFDRFKSAVEIGMAYEHEKSGTTIFLDLVRYLLIIAATSYTVFLIWKWNWIVALVAIVPVFIVMLNLIGFLTLAIYSLTPENRLKRKGMKAFLDGDFETGKALTDEFVERFHVNVSGTSQVPRKQKRAIEGLDHILAWIFIVLMERYQHMFPDDLRERNRHRAGVVINELVVEDLRGDQVQFRRENSGFIEREKEEAIRLDCISKGVLSFLVAKGGLYKSWGHPDADIWITEAKKMESNIAIPSTVKDVQELIDRCLAWYQDHA